MVGRGGLIGEMSLQLCLEQAGEHPFPPTLILCTVPLSEADDPVAVHRHFGGLGSDLVVHDDLSLSDGHRPRIATGIPEGGDAPGTFSGIRVYGQDGNLPSVLGV